MRYWFEEWVTTGIISHTRKHRVVCRPNSPQIFGAAGFDWRGVAVMAYSRILPDMILAFCCGDFSAIEDAAQVAANRIAASAATSAIIVSGSLTDFICSSISSPFNLLCF